MMILIQDKKENIKMASLVNVFPGVYLLYCSDNIDVEVHENVSDEEDLKSRMKAFMDEHRVQELYYVNLEDMNQAGVTVDLQAS